MAANGPHANNPPYNQTRYRPAGQGFAAADPIHPAPPHPATDRGRQGFSKNPIDTMSYSPTLSGFRGDARTGTTRRGKTVHLYGGLGKMGSIFSVSHEQFQVD